MSEEKKALSILLHAESKVGKSTLSTTCPPPILVMDVEGGWKFVKQAGFRSGVPLRRRMWDPLREAPPRYDGTWDFSHVMVTSWSTLNKAYEWLQRVDTHDFRSVVVDSVTEAQRRLKTQLRGMETMRIQDWGDLLMQMDSLIRGMRDLTVKPGSPIEVVLFIAETVLRDGKWRPSMQGQIYNVLPYWVDICGYLYVDRERDENNNPTGNLIRRLLIGNGVMNEIIAGERVQGALEPIITDPHITTMINDIFA